MLESLLEWWHHTCALRQTKPQSIKSQSSPQFTTLPNSSYVVVESTRVKLVQPLYPQSCTCPDLHLVCKYVFNFGSGRFLHRVWHFTEGPDPQLDQQHPVGVNKSKTTPRPPTRAEPCYDYEWLTHSSIANGSHSPAFLHILLRFLGQIFTPQSLRAAHLPTYSRYRQWNTAIVSQCLLHIHCVLAYQYRILYHTLHVYMHTINHGPLHELLVRSTHRLSSGKARRRFVIWKFISTAVTLIQIIRYWGTFSSLDNQRITPLW